MTAAGVHSGRRVRDVVQEALQHLHAVGGVNDLRVELDAVEAPALVLEGRDRRRGRGRDGSGAFGRRHDRVAVAHPDDLVVRQAGEQAALAVGHLELGPTELGCVRPIDPAAELPGHELHAVADAEHGHARLEERAVDAGRVRRVDGGRPAGEDDRASAASGYLGRADRSRHQLRVDPALAHAAGDQLSVLAAQVDDEDRAFLARLRHREREHRSVLTAAITLVPGASKRRRSASSVAHVSSGYARSLRPGPSCFSAPGSGAYFPPGAPQPSR